MTGSPAHDSAPAMTGAEFRAARLRMGASGEWIAATLGVNERQVRRWESGENTIPARIPSALTDLVDAQRALADEVVATLTRDGLTPGYPVWLRCYRTDDDLRAHEPGVTYSAGWHLAAMALACERLPGARLRFATPDPD